MTSIINALCARATETVQAWVADNWRESVGSPVEVLDNLITYDDKFADLWGQMFDEFNIEEEVGIDADDERLAPLLEAISAAQEGVRVERDYKPEIIQHLQAMCDEPIDPVIISIDTIQEGALFVHFAVGDIHQTAIYNPSDDSLFTPSDWQGKRPLNEADIEQYNWVNSAWDEAIVMAGLPRVFTAIRDSYRREFGRNVRAAREDKGISQPDLARLSGINQANISRIESGRYNVTLDTIARLSAILGPLT